VCNSNPALIFPHRSILFRSFFWFVDVVSFLFFFFRDVYSPHSSRACAPYLGGNHFVELIVSAANPPFSEFVVLLSYSLFILFFMFFGLRSLLERRRFSQRTLLLLCAGVFLLWGVSFSEEKMFFYLLLFPVSFLGEDGNCFAHKAPLFNTDPRGHQFATSSPFH